MSTHPNPFDDADDCGCDFAPFCDGSGVIRCDGCGGDFCCCGVCEGAGETECDGCHNCSDDDDDEDFVSGFVGACSSIALSRTPTAPKPTSSSALVAVHFDCRAGCDSPTGCRGSDG